MRVSRIGAALVLTTAPLFLLPVRADAQLGLYTLPSTDFRWNWGSTGLEDRRGSPDIEMSGSESFFRCELEARFRPISMSPDQVRAIESDLRTRMDFIYAVSEVMYYLEQSRYIDWATLDCKKYDPGPTDPAVSAERQNEAREKMLRELERRRARQRDDE